MSGRLGPINLGDKRQVFSDPNIPLGECIIVNLTIMYFIKKVLNLCNSSHQEFHFSILKSISFLMF